MIAAISLTNSCNYSCGYCIASNPCGGYKTNKAKVCSKSGITEIRGCVLDLDFLTAYLYKFVPESSTVVLTGGEPMSVPYFATLINRLDKICKVIVETNGSQLFKLPGNLANTTLHIAWHPKMTLLEKFIESIKKAKAPIKLVNIAGINDEIKGLHEEYEIIVNNGGKPELGIAYSGDLIFIRPNGKVMECPGIQAKQVGDIYDGNLDRSNLKPARYCHIDGYVFCNTILHASGIMPGLRLVTS
jgi:MoaA/NifB/PqqE/SkfB family radical SAM enzyme